MEYSHPVRNKTIFPHRYSKIFYDFWWSKKALWRSWLLRLKEEKDCFILITGDTGCLSGNTEVKISRAKNTQTWNLKHLYEKMNGLSKKVYSRNKFDITIPLYIRSLKDKEIRLNKINKILYSGKKNVWNLRLKNGFNLKATSDHRIMTKDGWIELGKLKINGLVMCDTPNAKPNNRKRIKLRDIGLSVGRNHPYNTKPNGQIEVHRLIYEARENNLNFTEYLDLLLNEPEKCKKLKFIDPSKYLIHHKDGCHYNNSIENLEKLEVSEHNFKHNNYSNFSQGMPKFSEVESIDYIGEEDTYDISCEAPYHNFVANNIVVHNSGKSHFTANMCFKFAEDEPNFVLNDGTTMFKANENFIIDPDEFAYKMITKEGQVLWLDEARRVANRRKWFSKINNAVADRKNQNRKLFNIYLLCMPFEKEFDPALASHLTMWIWVRRGVCEIYCKRSGVKGGTGLNIQEMLEREAKYLKENPKKTIVNPAIHPEYVGRIAFAKLTAGLEERYKKLAYHKKATGDLTDEEKKKYGIVIEEKPENIVQDAIQSVKAGKIKDKKELWNALSRIKETDEKKLKMINFYLKLEGWDNFNKLFDKSKVEKESIW